MLNEALRTSSAQRSPDSSAVIGPSLFGLVAQITGVTHYGVLAVMLMFLVGGGIFAFLVPKELG